MPILEETLLQLAWAREKCNKKHKINNQEHEGKITEQQNATKKEIT